MIYLLHLLRLEKKTFNYHYNNRKVWYSRRSKVTNRIFYGSFAGEKTLSEPGH